MKDLEIIIIGGGLAGLTAGIHLSRKGLRVIIIEKNELRKLWTISSSDLHTNKNDK